MRRAAEPPVIDGLLDDEVWLTAPVARNFVMLNPGNGPSERPSQKSEVRMLFDDEFLYVGARMFDAHPDSILTEYTPRDVYNRNHDWFGIFINPYNDGISDFNFRVTSAGVQSDSRNTVDGEDQGWNTVWYSKVRIDEQGWIVEMAIPYQSLRFAEDGPTSWGLNMLRYIRRKREEYSWNFIDKSVGTYEQQCGLMNGMVGIEPPVRLSFLPYLSGYMNDYQGQTDYSYRLGLDMKYGINESFTLDATLVPDFGQVPFDDQQLNLSPFELQFEENRPFFNEGVDLFSKGDLFYSRRIGGAPNNVTNAQASDTTLQPSIPEFTQLYNAVKLSGRTGGNLGIGVFNAVTANNYQEFTDPVSGARESVLIEPLTNYNILVFDQRLNRNSSLSLVNTSVLRNGDAHDALVTGLVTDLMNKKNSWRLNQEYIMSQRFFTDSVDRGFRISNRLSRIKGNFRFELGQELMPPDDGTGDQLREEALEGREAPEVPLGGVQVALTGQPAYVDDVGEGLEGEEADADGQGQLDPREAEIHPAPAQHGFRALGEPVEVLEEEQRSEQQDQRHGPHDGLAAPPAPAPQPLPGTPAHEYDQQHHQQVGRVPRAVEEQARAPENAQPPASRESPVEENHEGQEEQVV